MKREFTPEVITELKADQIFCFGSNMNGNHAGGAARTAVEKFLPNLKAHEEAWIQHFNEYGTENLYSFTCRHFPEALEHLLKAQRQGCLDEFMTTDGSFDGNVYAILNAPIPEPIKE